MRAKTIEQHYSVDQVSALLGMSTSWVWRRLQRYRASAGREGIGPAVLLGRRATRVPASAVNKYLETRNV